MAIDLAALSPQERMQLADQAVRMVQGSYSNQRAQVGNMDRNRVMDQLSRDPAFAARAAEAAGMGQPDPNGNENLQTAQASQGAGRLLDALMANDGTPDVAVPARSSSPPLPPRRPQGNASAEDAAYQDGGFQREAANRRQPSQPMSRVAEMGNDERTQPVQRKGAPNQVASNSANGITRSLAAGVGTGAAAAGVGYAGYLVYKAVKDANGAVSEQPMLVTPDGQERPATPEEVRTAPSQAEFEQMQQMRMDDEGGGQAIKSTPKPTTKTESNIEDFDPDTMKKTERPKAKTMPKPPRAKVGKY